MMAKSPSSGRITPDDIKSKLHDIQGEATQQVEDAKSQILTAVSIAGLVALIVVFLLGKRSGKRSSAVIEVRRG